MMNKSPNPPRDDEEFDEWVARSKREDDYQDYCKQHNLDPEDEANWEEWEENEKERASHGWDQMDPDDADGWMDNILKE